MMCKVFKINKSSYYQWFKGDPSKRWIENEQILVKIKETFEASFGSYGSPRIAQAYIGIRGFTSKNYPYYESSPDQGQAETKV